MILKKLIYVLVCVSLIGCTINNGVADNKRVYKTNEIPDNAIESVGGNDSFIYVIRFSNLIYNTFRTAKKQIKIPIFQGTLGNVEYNDFKSYCRGKNMLASNTAESGFVILTKRGELKKTLLEFIKFYEGNILKGYEKQVWINTSGDEPQYFEWIISYEFKVDNIPCLMVIFVSADEKDFYKPRDTFKSVEDIHLNENMETPSFIYQLNIDYIPPK